MIYVLIFILGMIIGAAISYFIIKKYLKKTFNPEKITENVITEDMIRSLLAGMGRTPTQKQINQIINKMRQKNGS